MNVLQQPIFGQTKSFGDDRGYFIETYNQRDLAQWGITAHFVQDNVAWSKARGTLRGLHFQRAPSAQAKLVRVLRGSIIDVIVDLREASPDYARVQTFELSARASNWLFVPAGFAHGYQTLEDDTLVSYKVDAFYDPATEGGVVWNDPSLAIVWPVSTPIVSPKDQILPRLDQVLK